MSHLLSGVKNYIFPSPEQPQQQEVRSDTSFQTFDGLYLHYQWWLPEGNNLARVKAVILSIHGYGEHCGLYDDLGNALVQSNYAMLGFDMRGFGQSQGPRRQVTDIEQYMNDLDCAMSQITIQFPEDEFPNMKIFIWGLGTGGTIATSYALRRSNICDRRVHGFILVGPAFRLGDTMKNSFKIPLVGALAYLLPSCSLEYLDVNEISSDPNYAKRLSQDKWVDLGGMPACYASVFLNELSWIRDHIVEFRYPVLVQHGECDSLTDPNGSKMMIQKCGSPDSTLELYTNMYHNLYHEFSSEQVIDDLIRWLQKRTVVRWSSS